MSTVLLCVNLTLSTSYISDLASLYELHQTKKNYKLPGCSLDPFFSFDPGLKVVRVKNILSKEDKYIPALTFDFNIFLLPPYSGQKDFLDFRRCNEEDVFINIFNINYTTTKHLQDFDGGFNNFYNYLAAVIRTNITCSRIANSNFLPWFTRS